MLAFAQSHVTACPVCAVDTLQPVDSTSVYRYYHEGAPVRSFDELRKIMEGNGFELRATEDMPFVIREHARKFQWGCAQGSAWVKTS